MPLNPSSVWLQQSIATKWHTSWHKQWNEGGFYDRGRWESCFSPVVMRTFFLFFTTFSRTHTQLIILLFHLVNFQFFTTLSLCAGLPTDSVSKFHMGASGLFIIILIYCRYLTCVINFRGNCQKEVSDFINDGGKDTQAFCTSISWETPEIKKKAASDDSASVTWKEKGRNRKLFI